MVIRATPPELNQYHAVIGNVCDDKRVRRRARNNVALSSSESSGFMTAMMGWLQMEIRGECSSHINKRKGGQGVLSIR